MAVRIWDDGESQPLQHAGGQVGVEVQKVGHQAGQVALVHQHLQLSLGWSSLKASSNVSSSSARALISKTVSSHKWPSKSLYQKMLCYYIPTHNDLIQVLSRDALGALPGQHLLGLQAGRVVGEQVGLVLSNKVL